MTGAFYASLADLSWGGSLVLDAIWPHPVSYQPRTVGRSRRGNSDERLSLCITSPSFNVVTTLVPLDLMTLLYNH